MKLSPHLKRRLRWQNWLFIVLLFTIVAALGWLSSNYRIHFDLTQSQSNYPSDETSALLKRIDTEISITAFVSPDNPTSRKQIQALIEKYRRIKTDITLEIIDPIRDPQMVRQYDIRGEGELIVTLAENIEKVTSPTEQNLTNALNHLTRNSQDWILFLEGHGERSPFGDTSFDYGAWRKVLKTNGLNVRNYNLAQNAQIPQNTQLLVIADPQKKYLQGELNILIEYVVQGGNLLWLIEPGDSVGLEPLAEAIGIDILPGTIVDPSTHAVGINDPRFVLVSNYPNSAITENLNSVSVYPTAAALELYGSAEWRGEVFLESLPRTWTTENDINDITIDSPISLNGPHAIGISLTHSNPATEQLADEFNAEDDEIFAANKSSTAQNNKQQRIIVMGDSDFASDAYLGEVGNIDIAINVISWLMQNEHFIDVTPKEKLDRHIELGKTQQIIIGLGILLVLPLGLVLTGFFIWRSRRKA